MLLLAEIQFVERWFMESFCTIVVVESRHSQSPLSLELNNLTYIIEKYWCHQKYSTRSLSLRALTKDHQAHPMSGVPRLMRIQASMKILFHSL